ncbi:hypothetical protein SAMN05421823_10596 [Catalinimonas alkaloidigena]|uniref:Uncharacterized protein n=1 Tax=Catalinimonas alkaloidigena TaxID=1075417 RepID=A0A1G9ISY9_9BACT|nr:hypothetical protein [Catalinimonas alkaloidigena]SDL28195.1 hypothetical protein SAMN05421823_10596 [Catalinimonas alkaloidigena]
MKRRVLGYGFLIWVGCLLSVPAWAQFSNLRCRRVAVVPTGITLDSLSLVPGSIHLTDVRHGLDSVDYELNTHTLRFAFPEQLPDSVTICYRVFPLRFDAPRFHRDPEAYDSTDYYFDDVSFRGPSETREQLFNTPGISKNGSITRGISFGNNQNVFVNSTLNLQLEGQLTPDIKLTGVISDQNVPFQPEGNTQQLQEFDQVYLTLEHQKGRLTAGDIVLKNPPSAFLRYYKNVQGGQAQATYATGEKGQATTTVSAAAAKGKFYSTPQLAVQEGVQGPYRLVGPNGETGIIVLANSERVFLDGRLLTRGFNNDYVIDYNQAEITFTQRIVITQYSRVRVDFEYAERNYSRTIFNASHYQTVGKFDVFFNHYQEGDNRNNPLTVELDTAARRRLSLIGDDLNQAVIDGAQRVDFTENEVLYVQRDTLYNGTVYPTYVFATNPQDTVYRVVFSDVGYGQGDYVQRKGVYNGRVFDWVGPGQGRYRPVRLIPTPNRRRLTTLGANFRLREGEKFYTEVAFSGYDKNRFSKLDADDDQGRALKLGYLNEGRALGFWEKTRWMAGVDYEYLSSYFNPIDRFRDVEFDRDWSANQGDTLRADDHLLNVHTGLMRDLNNRLLYRFSLRDKGENVSGTQQTLEAAKEIWRFQLRTQAFLLRNQRQDYDSEWERLSLDLAYQGRWLVPGYTYNLDHNRIYAPGTDSIVRTAMNYEEHRFYLHTPDTARTRLTADYSLRYDRLPQRGELVRNTEAQTGNLGVSTPLGKHQTLGFTGTYRKLDYVNASETGDSLARGEETVQGRLDWSADLLERHIRSELTFATATGRELRREFQYIPALEPGQGTHDWIDYNGNGIQELNEFVEAVNPDRRLYIKILVPTNEYVKAFTNNLVYRLNLDAPRGWRQKKGLRNLLSRFTNVSSWTVDRKITQGSVFQRFVPLLAVDDEDLLSTQQALRSTLFFNRTNPQFGWDMGTLQLRQKQLLTAGFDARQTDELRLNMRLNLKRKFNVQLAAFQQQRTSRSDFLDNRNYTILIRELNPELSWQPGASFRLTGLLSRSGKQNLDGAERATVSKAGTELRWQKVSVRSVNASLQYVRIAFTGNANSPLAYEMLEALQPGNNFTWAVNWQQKLANGLQLTFQYEGRKAQSTAPVHIGRMQVAALF